MPQEVTVVTVFVAATEEVSEEVQALHRVLDNLNITWAKSENLRLELLNWQNGTFPDAGPDPQAVINRQINESFDIFVAIFWQRIGTETPRAESGSLEELERAMSIARSRDGNLPILVYFKEAKVSPSKVDIEQLGKLQSLRSDLSDKGIRYSTFDELPDFEDQIRAHISSAVRSLLRTSRGSDSGLKTKPSVPKPDPTSTAQTAPDDDQELDFGLLDYIDIYSQEMETSIDALSSITAYIGSLTNSFTERTKEIYDIRHIDTQTSKKALKRIVKLSADDLNRFSSACNLDLQKLIASNAKAFHALSKGVSIQIEFGPDARDSLSGTLKSLKQFRQSIKEAKRENHKFMETVSGLPRLNVEFNRAKRGAAKILQQVEEEFELIGNRIDQVVAAIEEAT